MGIRNRSNVAGGFLKNWSYLTVSSITQQGLSFLCLVRIARVLAPGGYGEYTIILAAVAMGQVIAALGMPQIIIRTVSRNVTSLASVAREVFPVVTAGTSLSALAVASFLHVFASVTSVYVLLASSCLVLAYGFWAFAEALAYGRRQMEFSSLLNVGSSIAWAATIFLLPARDFSVQTVVVAFSIIQLIRPALYFLLEWRSKYFAGWGSRGLEPVASRKVFLKQSMPLFGTNILTLPITLLPVLFLGRFSGTEQVGFYGVGNKFVSPLSLISTSLLIAIYPVLAHEYANDGQNFLRQGFHLFHSIWIVSVAFAWALGMFGREIILTTFGQRYALAIVPFVLQLWTSCIIVALSFVGYVFVSADKENLMVRLSLFNAIVIGVSTFVGSHFGALGLAISSVGSYFIGFAVHWYVLRRSTLIGKPSPTGLERDAFILYVSLALVSTFSLSAPLVDRGILFSLGTLILFLVSRQQISATLKYVRIGLGMTDVQS